MKRNLELAYWKAKKGARRSYFKTGLGIFSLIAFSFALLSFFRPYYEHQNSYLPNDQATMVFSGSEISQSPLSAEQTREQAKRFAHQCLSRVEEKSSSRCEIGLLKAEDGTYVLAGPSGYDLSLLGKMPLTGGFFIPKEGDSVLLYDIEASPAIGLNTFFYSQIDSDSAHFSLEAEQRRSPGVEMPFDPLSQESVLFVMSWDTLPSSVSYTYSLLRFEATTHRSGLPLLHEPHLLRGRIPHPRGNGKFPLPLPPLFALLSPFPRHKHVDSDFVFDRVRLSSFRPVGQRHRCPRKRKKRTPVPAPNGHERKPLRVGDALPIRAALALRRFHRPDCLPHLHGDFPRHRRIQLLFRLERLSLLASPRSADRLL